MMGKRRQGEEWKSEGLEVRNEPGRGKRRSEQKEARQESEMSEIDEREGKKDGGCKEIRKKSREMT